LLSLSQLLLKGMKSVKHLPGDLPTDFVAQTFYTVANLPADPQNIVAMLEQELEPSSWPFWLRAGVNELISILEKMAWGCDA